MSTTGTRSSSFRDPLGLVSLLACVGLAEPVAIALRLFEIVPNERPGAVGRLVDSGSRFAEFSGIAWRGGTKRAVRSLRSLLTSSCSPSSQSDLARFGPIFMKESDCGNLSSK